MIEKLSTRFYGRVVFLLVLVAALNFGYPLTMYMGSAGNIIYLLIYAVMLTVGVLTTSVDKKHFIQTSVMALIWVVGVLVSLLNPASGVLVIIAQFAIVPAKLLMTIALVRYIYSSRTVDRNVMMTAIVIYILIGSMFASLFVVINHLDAGAFLDNGLGVAPQWQQLSYFSFVTLATLGYGDIVPLNPWARAMATVEAMVGVLYVAFIMGRLIGIYS